MNAPTFNKINKKIIIKQQKRKDECSKVHNNNIRTKCNQRRQNGLKDILNEVTNKI